LVTKGQVQPTVESSARFEGDGPKRRGLPVFQTHARKCTSSNTFDGDAYSKETIMAGSGHTIIQIQTLATIIFNVSYDKSNIVKNS
jgi:hypothetical protein